MYDAKRKVVWATDHVPNVSALKIDLKTANTQPLETGVKEINKP